MPSSEAPSFTLPAFYGSSATTLTVGEGRLARPKFRYTASLSIGYDDNIFQTPNDPQGVPDQEVQVLVDPGTPPTVEIVPIFVDTIRIGQGGIRIPVRQVVGFREVVTPGTDPVIENQVIPGTPPAERQDSLVTKAGLGFDVQLYSPRSLFTFDIHANADHFWDRPGPKQTDYNGGVTFSFLYRFTPRMQFTAQINAAYLSQPDLARINTPQEQGGGAYINSNAKLDLSYRWTPRLTSVASVSSNALLFQETAEESGNYSETIFGTELRYLWSPRMTVLGEVRYSTITYDQDPTRDSTTAYVLLGLETRLSARFSGTLRLGQSVRTFEQSGQRAMTPYMETSIAYKTGPTSVLNWNTRFGFEEPASAMDERLVFRSGLSYAQAFSPRLSGQASLNFLHDITTTEGAEEESVQDTIDGTLRLEYSVTKRFTLNSTYTYTTLITNQKLRDYYRSRLFIGGEYTF